MVNMDFKLGEWFKQVEKREQELKAKKKDGDEQPVVQQESAAMVEPVINSVEINEPAVQAQQSAAATMTVTEVVADTSKIDLSEPPVVGIENTASINGSVLFGEGDVPQVEDFLFLSDTGDPKPIVRDDEEPPIDIPMGRRRLSNLGPLDILSEGTGEPRPIKPRQSFDVPPIVIEPVAPRVEEKPEVIAQSVVEAKPAPAPEKVNVQKQAAHSSADSAVLEENWSRMPAHLQILFGNSSSEIAQNSYKAFKESRGEMIQRLLDPQLTLEEAARILNVCPTTVRRYTNRGALKHLRTAGNQRRFRLSDVLAFMESNANKASKK